MNYVMNRDIKKFVYIFSKKLITLYLPLIALLLFTLFPFYWIINTALKKEGDILSLPVQYFPSPPTFENFVRVMTDLGFDQFFVNSMIVTLTTCFLVILIALLGGYAIARFNFKGKGFVFIILFATQIFPRALLLVPLFLTFRAFDLIDTRIPLILTYTTLQIPFCTIMICGFFIMIPKEIEEVAMIDGCSRLDVIFRVLIPIIKPGIVATIAFCFVASWNEFIFALMFTYKEKLFTLPVGLYTLIGQYQIYYGGMSAGGVITLIPTLIMFAYLQKHLIKGLTAGAVKG